MPSKSRPYHSRAPRNAPFQGPEQPPTTLIDGIGLEDARIIREDNSRNTRYVDKPDANTTPKSKLAELRERQRAVMSDASRQLSTLR